MSTLAITYSEQTESTLLQCPSVAVPYDVLPEGSQGLSHSICACAQFSLVPKCNPLFLSHPLPWQGCYFTPFCAGYGFLFLLALAAAAAVFVFIFPQWSPIHMLHSGG